MFLDNQRRTALEEAMKNIEKKPKNEDLAKIEKELNFPPTDMDFLLSLPRVFSRSSARFELPMDSRTLSSRLIFDKLKRFQLLFRNCLFSNDSNGIYKRKHQHIQRTKTIIQRYFQQTHRRKRGRRKRKKTAWKR